MIKNFIFLITINLTGIFQFCNAASCLASFIPEIYEHVLQKERAFVPAYDTWHSMADAHYTLVDSFIPSTDYSLLHMESPSLLVSQAKRIALYDVGSTGTKLLIVDVDPHDPKNFTILDYTTIHTAFDITMASYATRVILYNEIKDCIDSIYGQKTPVHHFARATAGFRNAGELGLQIAKTIAHTSGIDFEVAQQQQEAIFAYESVIHTLEEYTQDLVVWDVGGGSIQITTKDDNDELISLGSGFASRSIIPLIHQYIKGNTVLQEPLFPMDAQQIDEAILAVRQLSAQGYYADTFNSSFLCQDVHIFDIVRQRIATQKAVYGVGAFHNQAIQANIDPDQNFYTKDQLKSLLYNLRGMTQEQAAHYLGITQPNEFFKYFLGDLILAYSTMEEMGIDTVYTLHVNNGLGLMRIAHQHINQTHTKELSNTFED